jgi:iron complex outermembrane receptor protein
MRFQSTQNTFPDNSSNNSDANSLYAEYQYWMQINSRIALNAGTSGTYSRVNSEFYGNHNGINLAGYAQFDVKASERLKLIAGLRLENNSLDSKRDNPALVFRTGLNYRLANYSFLRASFGQGYRYPSVAEKHASTTLGSVNIIPNPFIQPETGWNSELGIKQGVEAGKWLGLADLALFYSQNRNMIEYSFGLWTDPVTLQPVLGFQAGNTEQSKVFGFELESDLRRTSGKLTTLISGGYLFMYPVEFNPFNHQATGEFLKYRRMHSAKLMLDAEWDKVNLGLNLYVNSNVLRIDDVFTNALTRESILPGFYDYWLGHRKGYMLSDVRLAYNFSKRISLALAVKNLGNVEYMGRPGDIRPQRSVVLRLQGKF